MSRSLPAHRYGLTKAAKLCIILVLLVKDSLQGPNEDVLIKKLLTNYEIMSRPVSSEEQAVNVIFGLSLQQIVAVDEKNEMIHTNIWLNYNWTDYKMMWNISEYGNVESIRLPSKSVWTPDILLYNSAHEAIDSKYPTNIVVHHNGEMNWLPLGIYKSTCTMDIKWFPFDEQTCPLKFGSWSYDNSKINLISKSDLIETDNYSPSGEWLLTEYSAKLNTKSYQCCPEEYQDVTFTIRIRRRTLYHGINLIIPCVLVSILGIITFTLPPDAGEKITLSITVLLQLGVMSLIVAEMVPPTSNDVPLIGIYFVALMIMCTMSVLLSVLVLNLHHRNPNMHQMPPFVKHIVCEWMAWFLRMSRPKHDLSLANIKRQVRTRQLKERLPPSLSLISNVRDIDNLIPILHQSHTTDSLCNSHQPISNCQQPINNHQPISNHHMSNNHQTVNNHHSTSSTSSPPPPPPPFFRNGTLEDSWNHSCNSTAGCGSSLRNEVLNILNEVRYLTRHVKEDDEEKEEINDWKFAGMVIDRLCFWIASIFLVVFTLAIFLSAPQVMSSPPPGSKYL